jgi:hypothetical protein
LASIRNKEEDEANQLVPLPFYFSLEGPFLLMRVLNSPTTIQSRFKTGFLMVGCTHHSSRTEEALANCCSKSRTSFERRVQRIVKSPSEPTLPLCYDRKDTDFV